jgi:DNA polymerase I-like protein with 3'-5' exonuclease and polymerase domains
MVTTAARCYGASDFSHAEKCRGYLGQVIHETQPERIIAFGKLSQVALFGPGRVFDAGSVHGAYNFLFPDANNIVEKPTPVFMLADYGSTMGNSFARREWERGFLLAMARRVKPFTGEIVYVTDDNIDQMLAECRAAEWVAFDVEHYGEPYEDDFDIFCGSVSPKGSNKAWMWYEDALAKGTKTLSAFQMVLKDANIKLVLQNGKSDIVACYAAWGFLATGFYGDTRLWSKLLDVNKPASLKLMCEAVGMGGYKQVFDRHLEEAVKAIHSTKHFVETSKNQLALMATHDPKMLHAAKSVLEGAEPKRFAYKFTPKEAMVPYNARDSVATARLGKRFEAKIRKDKYLWATWDTLVRPAADALIQAEVWGVNVSREAMTTLGHHLDRKLAEVRRNLSLYGDFNPASTPDLYKLLYERLDLPVLIRTDKGQPSTGKAALNKLRDKHPVVPEILEWRRLEKLKGTYVVGMMGLIRPDGRIHPTFNLDGAKTGRLSAKNPNTQNLPRGKDKEGPEARMVKSCFVAPHGKVLVSCDFSQIELRVAAAISGDPVMKDIYRQGVDFHQRTAELIAEKAWGLRRDQVEKEHRDIAKVANFLSVYGGGDSALSRSLNCTEEDAAKIRGAILVNFSRFAEWSQEQTRFVRKHGYVWIPFVGQPHSRKRALPGIASDDSYERKKAARAAVNSPVQGMASDICLASFTKIVEWVKAEGLEKRVKVVLIVHDDIILECDEDLKVEVANKMREIMTAWDIGVPLEVEAKIGRNWGNLKQHQFS